MKTSTTATLSAKRHRVFSIGNGAGFCQLLLAAFALILSRPLYAQTRIELSSLIFEPVYLNDANQNVVLNSSSELDRSENGITAPEDGEQQSAAILDGIRRYESDIETLVETAGAFDPRLAQQYLSAGTLYRQIGDYEKAVSAFENAMYIQRVNQGLFSLSQVEAVKKLIETNKALNNYAEADKYHGYLYYLQSRNPDPAQGSLAAAAMEWADWNMEAFRRLAFQNEEGLSASMRERNLASTMLRRGELIAIQNDLSHEVLFVPRTELFSNPGSVGTTTFRPEELVDPRLKKADELYESVIEDTEKNDPPSGSGMAAIYRKANITHLFKSQLEKIIGNNLLGSAFTIRPDSFLKSIPVLRKGYRENKENIQSLAAELETSDKVQAAKTYINLADWELSFDRSQRANDAYDKARSLLLSEGFTEEQVTSFITPQAAMFIPVFATHEGTRQFQNIPETADLPYKGFIDVSFDKRRDGELRNLRIENASRNTGQAVRTRLLDLLKSVKVRPEFVAGQAVEHTDIRVRYYYTY